MLISHELYFCAVGSRILDIEVNIQLAVQENEDYVQLDILDKEDIISKISLNRDENIQLDILHSKEYCISSYIS
jgi:hypothetical protein